MTLIRWQQVAEESVRQGGEEVRRRFGTGLTATAKRGPDLVTAADLASEERILDVLRAAEPSFGLVSEEAGAQNGDAEYVWLVDPLDGTNNFAIDSPYVGVAVTLLRHDEPIVAVTHNPIVGTVWSATAGGGAYRDGIPIRVNPSRPPAGATVAFVQGYPAVPSLASLLQGTIFGQVKRILTNWAPALDWCLLAHGGIDALISLDSEQEDQLGGALIAREAGALLTDFDGRVADPAAPRLLAAASSATQRHLLDLFQKFNAGSVGR